MPSNINSIIDGLINITMWSTLVVLSVGLLRLRDLRNGLIWLVILAAISLTADLISSYYKGGKTVLLVTPRIYSIFEFACLSMFFYWNTNRAIFRKVILVMIVVFFGVAVIDWITVGINHRDDLPLAVEALTLITYSVVTLGIIITDAQYQNILSTPQFWIIAAILIYFGGNIFVFASSNYIAKSDKTGSHVLWGVHALIRTMYNLLMVVGIWKAKESR